MDTLLNALAEMIGGPSNRLWPLYLPGMILLAYFVYRKERRQGGFIRWLFPKEIYLHRSHLVDIQLFLVGRLLSLLGLFQKLAITTLVTVSTINLLGGTLATEMHLGPWMLGFLLLLASDFATYWIHRIHHENPTLWPFHAVHHSAEVMTPVTAYRKHPIYDIIGGMIRGVILGLAQGILLSFFVSQISIALVLGLNVFYVVFNAVTGNLRHTHVWLSFGPVVEHILISPAQHQVHHSIEVKHYNKNYGEVLAIWDWMFGTLYVPQTREELRYGLGDSRGERIAQPHDNLAQALIGPVKDSLRSLRGGKSPQAEADAEAARIGPAE